MKQLFDDISFNCSKEVTLKYSTSFSMGIKLLAKDIQPHIYNIYGFVRLADEIVDSFHEFEQAILLDRLKTETFLAIEEGISTNPILNSFQSTVNQFDIDKNLIEQFLFSMEMDLKPVDFTDELYKKYIVGSAEVVGLMCLQVFLKGDKAQFESLKNHAEALGSVFQKVNFLRDLKYDYKELNRTYFPNVDVENLSSSDMEKIFQEIEGEFDFALEGIKKLPNSCKFGVFLAYRYYRKLFQKIKRNNQTKIMEQRIRIPNGIKAVILFKSLVRHQLNWY